MNKFEVYLSQAKQDEYILNKLKSEINKYDANVGDMEFADKDIYINRINSILDILRNSRVINKVKELNEDFDYEKLSKQYKKLYDNVVLNNFFNEEISSFSKRLGKGAIDLPSQIEEYIMMIDENIYHENTELNALYKLREIREINTNMVVVGKNGSGKSTFINSFRNLIDSNIYTINSDRILNYKKDIYQGMPFPEKIKGDFEKVFKSNDYTNIRDTNFEIAMKYLIKHETIQNQVAVKERKSTQILNIMNEIFPYLRVFIDPNIEEIKVKNLDENLYTLNEMSSGEKSALYLITVVILAEENSYFLIDEPEINLNPYLGRKLWDTLESVKYNSIFIYATHDRDFASSRINSTYIWNKGFKYPDIWFQEAIYENDLSKELLFDLLGEADQKLLVEGTYGSLDYKFFRLIFNHKHVVPLGGHQQVIYSQRAINSKRIAYIDSKSIIDRDFYPDIQLDGLREKGIYALPYNEIENMLYKIAVDHIDSFTSEMQDSLKQVELDYEENFIQEVENLNKEVIKYNIHYLMDDVEHIDDFINNYSKLYDMQKEENFSDFFDFESEKMKDLNLMLKKIPLKNSINKNLCNEIIKFISNDTHIQKEIRQNYFHEII